MEDPPQQVFGRFFAGFEEKIGKNRKKSAENPKKSGRAGAAPLSWSLAPRAGRDSPSGFGGRNRLRGFRLQEFLYGETPVRIVHEERFSLASSKQVPLLRMAVHLR